ncbi:hypothetical protein HPB47_006298 [Ixodes persulcatus]|uniref:Uncharacterized protein n=1 Tax=Ixodes persulcatus TaxID=34615 RepID=A0AC60PB85_IXOPE|nr:hypothetical protein HPB47_006298 [Ixodes persulcatus]
MLLNAKLKQLCKRIRARYIDLSRELASIPAMQKDGLHYRTEGSQVVTDRGGALVTHFLGMQRRENFSGHTGSNRGRYGTHPTVVNRSEAGKKAHAHDLPGLSSGPRTSGAHRVVNTPPIAKETVKQPVPNFPGPVYSPQRQRDHPPQSLPLHAIWVPPFLIPPNGHLQGQSCVTLPSRTGSQEGTFALGPTARQSFPVCNPMLNDWMAGSLQHPTCAPSQELTHFVHQLVRQQLAAMQLQREC